MGAQGTNTIDFGAFPGLTDASVAQASGAILSGSLAEAWIYPVATVDHSADEHMVAPIKVVARDVVAGVGFTIFATVQDIPGNGPSRDGIRLYGLWTVAWVWN